MMGRRPENPVSMDRKEDLRAFWGAFCFELNRLIQEGPCACCG